MPAPGTWARILPSSVDVTCAGPKYSFEARGAFAAPGSLSAAGASPQNAAFAFVPDRTAPVRFASLKFELIAMPFLKMARDRLHFVKSQLVKLHPVRSIPERSPSAKKHRAKFRPASLSERRFTLE